MAATANTSQVNLSKEATQRLLRDLKEVQKEPIKTVFARPLDNDLSEWHCGLTPEHGPYKGTAFHLTLTFPGDYPNTPPRVHFSTYLRHPNVFGSYICLDMITQYGRPYRGWSTAYSVQSILLQLQSFLFAENVDQDYGMSRVNRASALEIERAKEQAAGFDCESCGFKGYAPTDEGDQPRAQASRAWRSPSATINDLMLRALETSGRARTSAQLRSSAPLSLRIKQPVSPGTSTSLPTIHSVAQPAPTEGHKSQAAAHGLRDLPTDVLVGIMDRLDAPSLNALVRASAHCARACQERGAWVRRELQCFHSKRGFTEEVLGFGIAIRGFPEDHWLHYSDSHCTCPICNPLTRREATRKGKWEGVLLMDYLSSAAFFDENVHKGVWNEEFQWWLPLLLDDQHSARAMPLLKGTISALAGNPQRHSPSREAILRPPFAPLDALKVLPRLMNSMVVSFMKQTPAKDRVDLHASEKALLGYCQLHHMLLRLAQDYPVIQRELDRVLSDFHRKPDARTKARTPDLGELLVLLSVAKQLTWPDLAAPFVEEAFDRNVLWTLRDHPRLVVLEPRDTLSEDRLSTTFAATAVSRQLIMFQVAFLLLVRPPGSSVRDIAATYTARYGYPRPGLTRELQKTWYRVLKVATWPSFFAQLGLPSPHSIDLSNMLRQAVCRSNAKGYHSSKEILVQGNRRTRTRPLQRPSYDRTGQYSTSRTGRASSAGSGRGLELPSAPPRQSRASLSGRDRRQIPRQPEGPTILHDNPFSVLQNEE